MKKPINIFNYDIESLKFQLNSNPDVLNNNEKEYLEKYLEWEQSEGLGENVLEIFEKVYSTMSNIEKNKPNWRLELRACTKKDDFMLKSAEIMCQELNATNYNSAIYFKSLRNGEWIEMNGINVLQEHFFVELAMPQLPKHLTEIFKAVASLAPKNDIPSNVLYTPTQKITIDKVDGSLSVEKRKKLYEKLYVPSIDVEYNTNAIMPTWFNKALNNSFSNDNEKLQAYFQMIGLTLFMERQAEVSYWFIGDGSTGKSTTVVEVLNALLDKQRDISSVQPSQWDEEKFFLNQMVGKRVNISTDSSNNKVLETGAFKKLVSGELTQANIKGVTPATFQNKALLVSVGNEMPVINEKSSGPFRRMIVIDMNNKIEDKDKNLSIKEDIHSNKDGVLEAILLLAITSIRKFYIDGKMPVKPAASHANVKELQDANNKVSMWFAELDDKDRKWIHYQSDFGITLSNAYTWYKSWSEDSGYRNSTYGKHQFNLLFREQVSKSDKFELYNRNRIEYLRVKQARELEIEDPFAGE